MTNKELAKSLRGLAEIYENTEGLTQKPGMYLYASSKAELLVLIHQIGGRFTKKYNQYNLNLYSLRIPGLTLSIARDAVCRKVVTYECEPLLSPNEEDEIDAAALSN